MRGRPSRGENEYNWVRTSKVETLLVGGDLDFATPPELATRELMPHLPNGHQVVLPNMGHTDDSWSYEPAGSSRLINTFLDIGKVDQSLYTRNAIDFALGSTQGTWPRSSSASRSASPCQHCFRCSCCGGRCT